MVGLVAFRWAALAWMVVVAVVTADRIAEPGMVVALVGAAAVITATWSVVIPGGVSQRTATLLVSAELAVGGLLVMADRWVWESDTGEPLASAWPFAGVLGAGVLGGPGAGGLAGGTLGLLNGLAGGPTAAPVGDRALNVVASGVLFALAGAAAGLVTDRLRTAERRLASAEAREEVARTLHDGVLQTLAVIQRRGDDAHLVQLARSQEQELRAFLFGDLSLDASADRDGADASDLGASVRAVAARSERTHGGRVDVVVADEPDALPARVVQALSGAVGEALTNAAKHGHATKVVVFVDLDDDGVFCSVKDDGRGYDPATTPEGEGIRGSIRGRVEGLGGSVDVVSAPGRGTDVRLRVPMKEARR